MPEKQRWWFRSRQGSFWTEFGRLSPRLRAWSTAAVEPAGQNHPRKEKREGNHGDPPQCGASCGSARALDLTGGWAALFPGQEFNSSGEAAALLGSPGLLEGALPEAGKEGASSGRLSGPGAIASRRGSGQQRLKDKMGLKEHLPTFPLSTGSGALRTLPHHKPGAFPPSLLQEYQGKRQEVPRKRWLERGATPKHVGSSI